MSKLKEGRAGDLEFRGKNLFLQEIELSLYETRSKTKINELPPADLQSPIVCFATYVGAFTNLRCGGCATKSYLGGIL